AGTSVAQFPLRPSCSAMRAPTWVAVASTTAIRFNPPPRPSCPERKKTTPNSTGPSSAPTQNQRVRTRSTNSRRTIAQILRIGSHGGLRRLRADQIDEDLQERRLAQLEACQPRPRRDQVAQDALWVRSWSELDLGVLTVVIDLFHERCIGEDPCRRADAAVESDHEMVSAPGVLDVAEWAIHQLPPARDDAHVLAQLLRLFHDMGREQDGGAAGAQLEDRVFHHLGIDGIPAGAPNRRTEPASGWMMSMIMRIVVVLPAPLGPSSP